ncbi:50S ribosomal protein L1 [Candidatus Microgenomates bacterium]|nr:50S ribosomal protein L1 [Candidatus Microgenomates bacterium]
MAPSEEELERLSVVGSQLSESGQPVDQSTGQQKTDHPATENRKQRTDNRKPRHHGQRYQNQLLQVDKNKLYPLSEAVSLIKKFNGVKFDQTVELHINTIEKGVSGQLTLPHGTGKKVRVAVATDDLLGKIDKGQIDFDVLLAIPSMMPKLAKVAKILGPRGLMPNPKNGTITDNPEKLAGELSKGNQLRFKTESQAPIIHLSVGKLSMKDEQLTDNIRAILTAIGPAKIKNVTLKSTMSPGIKLLT